MTANITFNPQITTNAAGAFLTSNSGYVQGTALDDPAIRNTLAGGTLLTTETLPMWGGVGLTENIPYNPNTTAQPRHNLGGIVARATKIDSTGAAGALTAFSVFDQNYSAINSPQSPVPLAGTGMQVNYYRLGSGMRIAVKCDPALISLDGSPVTQRVSWDFTAQKLVQYSAAYVANPITGLTWASTSGGRYTFTVTNDLSAILVAGDTIDVSGVVSTFALNPNGSWVVVSVTATTIVVTAAAAANAGAYTSGGTVAAAGGALPIQGVLDVAQTNCMTVTYNTTTGFATWNYNDCCAIIRL